MMNKVTIFVSLLMALFAAPSVTVDQADALYESGAYREALELYRQLDDSRWSEFRIADCEWRDFAAAPGSDRTTLEAARKRLAAISAETVAADERDPIWAAAAESLGDSYRLIERYSGGAASVGYQRALDYWAASTEVDRAREQFLHLIRKSVDLQNRYQPVQFGMFSIERYEQALSIAQLAEDRALASFLLAESIAQRRGDWRAQRRLPELYEAAIADPKSGWQDAALLSYARWNEQQGQPHYREDGTLEMQPDLPRALELYRELTRLYSDANSPWVKQASSAIDRITLPQLNVATVAAYRPGELPQMALSARNIRTVELTLKPIDLSQAISQVDSRRQVGSWLQRIDLSEIEPLRSWTVEFEGGYPQEQKPQTLESKLKPGAYLVEATAGEIRSRDLLMITKNALIVKMSSAGALAYVADAASGKPKRGARVQLWQFGHDEAHWRIDKMSGTTDGEGLTTLDRSEFGSQFFAVAAVEGGPAIVQSHYWGGQRQQADSWHLYAFADRPAYRPGETAHFKAVLRGRRDGAYFTPAGEQLRYVVRDARGNEVLQGEWRLNEFGSASATLELDADWPLGEYRISVTRADSKQDTDFKVVGGATLFRLEEYKLPEFTVRVKSAGARHMLGDTLELEVVAEYTFGGPVAAATVELVVYEQPYYRYWQPQQRYGWLAESSLRRMPYRGGKEIKRERLTTDAEGRATLRLPTPFGRDSDLQFRIEARVTDGSRREVSGETSIRVGQRSYGVQLAADHRIYRPGDRVRVGLRSETLDEDPVAVEGSVKVIRRRWKKSEEQGGGSYSEKLVQEISRAATGEDGVGEFEFAAAEEGFYTVRWFSRDTDGGPIRAETQIWVADRATRDLGYHHQGVEILLDSSEARVGEPLPLMLSVDSPRRWVLLTVEADTLIEHRLVYVEGDVKLITLDVDERYLPNVYVTASTIFDHRLYGDNEMLSVPPVSQFLAIDLQFDAERFEPGDEGKLTVRATDADGEPVSAELAVSLVDNSIFAIQSDYARDMRAFFYGDQRGIAVQTASSFQTKMFAKGAITEGEPVNFNIAGSRDGEMREDELSLMESSAPMAQRAMAKSGFVGNLPVGGASQPIQMRSDFRSTVIWLPHVVTDKEGRAELPFTMPDSLTTWTATVRAATRDAAVGNGEAQVKTDQPLIVRLQQPRFLTVGDRATISGLVRNDSEEALEINALLEVEGLRLLDSGGQTLRLAAGEERRLDWQVEARDFGAATLSISVDGGAYSDGMRREVAVVEHGIEKLVAQAARLADGNGRLEIELPDARRATELSVQVTPSMAVAMLDALPYLIEYPYGCTEQTMSRFLPAALVARTLTELGVDGEAAVERLAGADLDGAVRQGVARLADLQQPDGGWGWWREGRSDLWMTSYVVWGLSIAEQAELSLPDGMLGRGVAYLQSQLGRLRLDRQRLAFALFAMGEARGAIARKTKTTDGEREALDFLWERHTELQAYPRALFALASHHYGDLDRARQLARNLANGVTKVNDSTYGTTAHWGASRGWWRWYQSPIEATSFALQALLTIDPDSEWVAPAVDWLIQNRHGARWSNTRDTAIAILSLTDYLPASDELRGEHRFTVELNGKTVAERSLSGEELLASPSRFVVDAALVRDGTNRLTVRRSGGSGPLYAALYANFFSLEEPITPASHQIVVERRYERLVNTPTLLAGPRLLRQPFASGESLDSGDRVEVILTLESMNDFEYLLFEDLKPAGLEAIGQKSGGGIVARQLAADGSYSGAQASVYRELRDQKVALFVDRLPQGRWEIRYTMRAEVPGEFHALPLMGEAMYVPEIRANGREAKFVVKDRAF
jgi:uncharacterized protein YfaS (alpha-2-macroglobulin family)